MPTEHRIIPILLIAELITHKNGIALENHFKVRFAVTSKELIRVHDDLLKFRADCKFAKGLVTKGFQKQKCNSPLKNCQPKLFLKMEDRCI